MALTMMLSCCVFNTQIFAQTCNTFSFTPGTVIDDTAPFEEIACVGLMGTITDVDVSVDIEHTWSSDLELQLVSPDGTLVNLAFDHCGGDDDLIATFDDAAAAAVGSTCPINGTFQPDAPLSAFNGEDPFGNWELIVNDDAGGDDGILNSWSITVCANTTPIPFTELTICETDPDGDLAGTGLTADCGACVGTGGATGTLSLNDDPAGVFGISWAGGDTGLRGTFDITIADNCGTIGADSDIVVCVEMEHTWSSDIDIQLISPNGIVGDVNSDNNGSGDLGAGGVPNGAGGLYCFQSGAGTGLLQSTPGTYDAEFSGTDFVGEPVDGVWQVLVYDDTGGDDGTVFSASVSITPTGPLVTPPTVIWYNAATGGTQQGTGSPFNPTGTNAEEGAFNPNMAGTYTYYVVCEIDGCESEATEVTLEVIDVPEIMSVMDDCTGGPGTGTITIMESATPINGAWQYSIDGGTTWQTSSNFTGLADGNYTPAISNTLDPTCIVTDPVVNIMCVAMGCTDACAPNYDPAATQDNGSCMPYNMTCNTDCTVGPFGGTWDAATCACINETAPVLGCTDPAAGNYNPAANCDDGSCAANSVLAIDITDPCNCANGLDLDGDGTNELAQETVTITPGVAPYTVSGITGNLYDNAGNLLTAADLTAAIMSTTIVFYVDADGASVYSVTVMDSAAQDATVNGGPCVACDTGCPTPGGSADAGSLNGN